MNFAPAHRLVATALCAAALSMTMVAEAADPADWQPTAEGLRHMADYWPFETVEKGDEVFELKRGEPIAQGPSVGLDLDAFNRENLSTGMIVLHKGRIVYENYWLGADAESHFASWSMVKSVTSTLIGIAEAEGFIESIEDPIIRYVPELAGTAYRDVTIEQALQMSSGVRFDEQNDALRFTCLVFPPGSPLIDCDDVRAEFGLGLERFLKSLDERAAPPGTRFNYSEADAQVLGWVLRNAIGRSPAEYLSEKIWRPLGMEDDAMWLLDRPGGMPLAGASINARLRDYARFGLLMLNDGVYDGKRILPQGWVERATRPGKPYLKKEGNKDGPIGYQYLWVALPEGAFEAQGTQGQFLLVDPQHELVVAKTSVWSPRSGPGGWDADRSQAFHATVRRIVRALGYD